MNRLIETMEELRSRNGRGIAPYVTAGDGGLEVTRAALVALEEAGATCVELGLPFSDPIADGPVLQAAAQRALEAGTTFEGTLAMVRTFRGEGGSLPILLFGYANTFVRRGWKRAMELSAASGVDGLLVPDVPLEEFGPVRDAALASDLACVPFVAPTSSDERIVRAAELSRGFLYAIARVGVTGRATELDSGTLDFVERVRGLADGPLALGFGIRGPEQVAAVTAHADLAVVGSALVEAMYRAGSGVEGAEERCRAVAERASRFLQELSRGLPGGSLGAPPGA